MTVKVRKIADEEYAREMKKKLKNNNGYCPCALEKTEDTKCMCKAFRDQIDAGVEGYCHCGYYQVIIQE